MKKIDKVAMGRGYEEMAEINLTIVEEFFHAEDEGAKLYELDSTECEDKAE